MAYIVILGFNSFTTEIDFRRQIWWSRIDLNFGLHELYKKYFSVVRVYCRIRHLKYIFRWLFSLVLIVINQNIILQLLYITAP